MLYLTLTLLFSAPLYAQTTFTKITSLSGLEVGANYLIVAHHNEYGTLAMGYQKTNNRHAVVVNESSNSITITPGVDPNSQMDVFQFTLGGGNNAWTFFDEAYGGYLYAASSSSNQLKTQSSLDDNCRWNITFNTDGTAEVIAQGINERNNMRFNPNIANNSPMFCCYAGTSNIDTRVSFYKGGEVVNPIPEPSNYPTNFTGSVEGVDVTLTWSDATGSQLPEKYLVLASTGNIVIPSDGIPIADGLLAKNIDYGVQTIAFNGLQGNETYHFAIFPYTNSGSWIDYKTNGNYPTANITTENIEVLLFEDFNEDLGAFTAYDVIGEQSWHQASYQGINYVNMNGYAGGMANQNEDWLISPTIIIPNNNDVFVKFRTAMKFEGEPLRVMVSTNYNGQNDPNNSTWTDITSSFSFSQGNYDWVESGRVKVNGITGIFHLAFVYTSNFMAASSWEIDYVSIDASETTTYTITTTASPSNAGTITGAGSYASGSTCTLRATPNSGYRFVNWLENGTSVSTNATYSFTVTGNRNLVAVFDVAPTNYTITATANPSNGGSVDGGGTYASGSTCTLRASANSGYTFVNWTKNGTQVSTNPNYSFTVTGNASYVANFEQEPEEYTITVNAEPASGGTVSGGGTYAEGSTCVISAMPNDGYVFENWTLNGAEVSTSPSYSFIVGRSATYVAHFAQNANQATITAMAEPVEGGSVSGGGTYELGSNCTLNAVATVGYEFVNWTLNGSQVSTDASFSFTVTGNAVYVAHFSKIVNHYTVSANVQPANAGSVIGAGTYEEGTSCTLIAIANPTYTFVSWTENGAVVSTDEQYTFSVERDRNLVAVFSQGQFYTITATAGPNGTITPEGEIIVEPGQDRAFTIIPNEGCRISKVLIDGVDMGPIPSYNFRNVHENHSIRAQFSGLGVDDNPMHELKVYPNPANDKINIQCQNMKQVSIFNLFGVQIERKDVNDDHAVLSTDNLPHGTYILKVENNDGRIGYTRFILMK